MHKTQQVLKQAIDDAKRQVEIGSEYVHYKNPTMRYKVIDLAIHTDDTSVCVVYRALYDEGLTFVRPLKEWLDTVEVGDNTVRRFTLLEG
jgi:hypothetical protein